MSYLDTLLKYAKEGNVTGINWLTGRWYPLSESDRTAYRALAIACLVKVAA